MAYSNVMQSELNLVYPPVSSYEADALKQDPEVEKILRQSALYAMATRPEVTFDEVKCEIDGFVVTVSLSGYKRSGEPLNDTATIDLGRIASETNRIEPDVITCEIGPKIMRFWAGSEKDVYENYLDEPFEWYTTEKLIYDKGRGVSGITGLEKHRDFATYELLYVGIAKTSDTFTRLFDKAHSTRQKILSGEYPHRCGARVSDELILFPFRVNPTILRTLDSDDVPSPMSEDGWEGYRKRVVADAEKAFVNLLDPQYNVQKFVNYPRGSDGLYGVNHDLFGGKHDRYGYVIAENLTFATDHGEIRGARHSQSGWSEDSFDWILVEGNVVSLISGLLAP